MTDKSKNLKFLDSKENKKSKSETILNKYKQEESLKESLKNSPQESLNDSLQDKLHDNQQLTQQDKQAEDFVSEDNQYVNGVLEKIEIPASSPAVLESETKITPLSPGLYLLPSPLGNLSDISQRFIEVISGVQVVAAEDTRRTLKLLNHLGLKKTIYSYREENHRTIFPTLYRHLTNGEAIALISDAGAPGICDPGAFLVSEIRKAGLMVYPVPGPSVVITALKASGFEVSRFSFLSFLPAKDKLPRELIESVKDRLEPLLVFIPPHKLIEDLTDLSAILGSRPAFMGREMTKFHEEYLSLDLESLLAEVTANPRRGEVT
ncbi:MAG: 16S rRNA (cytidine(1402)-2'-O)-methyltransferase, partial [Deltaproteobacteria bacterium]|nr:16S rRNA (cytidine(1402)-2'-O)-methyltransferase [Deltaproteobacteria bacterium]